jgi:hypothetical protein
MEVNRNLKPAFEIIEAARARYPTVSYADLIGPSSPVPCVSRRDSECMIDPLGFLTRSLWFANLILMYDTLGFFTRSSCAANRTCVSCTSFLRIVELVLSLLPAPSL